LGLNIPGKKTYRLALKALILLAALRLSRYSGTSAQFWLNLKHALTLKMRKTDLLKESKREITPFAEHKKKAA
jgi:hypothetical protein